LRDNDKRYVWKRSALDDGDPCLGQSDTASNRRLGEPSRKPSLAVFIEQVPKESVASPAPALPGRFSNGHRQMIASGP